MFKGETINGVLWCQTSDSHPIDGHFPVDITSHEGTSESAACDSCAESDIALDLYRVSASRVEKGVVGIRLFTGKETLLLIKGVIGDVPGLSRILAPVFDLAYPRTSTAGLQTKERTTISAISRHISIMPGKGRLANSNEDGIERLISSKKSKQQKRRNFSAGYVNPSSDPPPDKPKPTKPPKGKGNSNSKGSEKKNKDV
ncbi:uncharacterized protein PAC_01512 [Phialocephala subalpina]|uniref:Uncharacterized protein n=1 Tax=Phialocephala subalpina TaxID=576137 RepID=A0A1L7WFT8_9HELO|nr:uncharacterized protein PAC_01512 [Phialocephala subalpina]